MNDSDAGLMTIFNEALERSDSDARKAYLDQVCGTNIELRQRLEDLLKAHEGVGKFLDPNLTTDLGSSPQVEPNQTQDHKPLNATQTFGVSPNATSPVKHRTQLTLGDVVAGKYTLVDVIGEGGMGSVYLASQTEPVKRNVALKLIKAGVNSKSVLARFDAERQALALMDHPNIARIYDGGVTENSQPFFVMELVQGVPLTEYCDEKRLSVEARLQLFVSICHAIQHAHQKGIIHRDLKPGNILVTEIDGRPTPKVIDFGVAKATEQRLTDMSLVEEGAIVGTPAYMSPEQADPSTEDIDTRSDVYALGVILYELLTGTPPIDKTQFKKNALLEMLRMVREMEAPRPSSKLLTSETLPNIAAKRNIEPAKLSRLLQGELDWVVLKALEKDRNRRYESANSFALDVQRYLADEVVEARPPSRSYRLQKFVKRNKGQVIAASLVMFALIAGMIGTTFGLLEAKEQAQLASKNEKEARSETELKNLALGKAQEEETRASQEAIAKGKALVAEEKQRKLADDRLKEQQYNSALDTILLAQSAFENGNTALAKERLLNVPVEYRRWEWHYLRRKFEGGYLTLYGHRGTVNGVSYSPDGNLLVTAGHDQIAIVWDAKTGEQRFRLQGHQSPVIASAFHPDGNSFVTVGERKVIVWETKTGKKRFETKQFVDCVTSVKYHPNGESFATGHRNGKILFWNAQNGELLREVKAHTSEALGFPIGGLPIGLYSGTQITRFDFSPDGKRIISAGSRSAKIWNTETGAVELTFPPVPSALVSVGFARDGNSCVTSDGTTISFWNTRTGEQIRQVRTTQQTSELVYSPDGRYLAGTSRMGILFWDLVTFGVIREFRGHTQTIFSIAFSPDSRSIATGSADFTAKLWDVEYGQSHLELQVSTRRVGGVDFSPDGKYAISANADMGGIIWNLSTGEAVHKLTKHAGGVTSVAYHPNGKQVATAGGDRVIKLWDAEKAEVLHDLKGHQGSLIQSLFYSEKGDLLISAGDEPRAFIWDTVKASSLHTLKLEGVCRSAALSRDGRFAATSEANLEKILIRVWDVVTGNQLASWSPPEFRDLTHLRFSPDGSEIYAACNNFLSYVWSTKGEYRGRFSGHSDLPGGLTLSPDGTRLATTAQMLDRSTILWDTRTTRPLLRLTDVRTSQMYVAFDRTQSWLASCGMDGVLLIRDGRPLPEPITLKGHTDVVKAVAWNHDGTRIASGGYDGVARIWDTQNGNVLREIEIRQKDFLNRVTGVTWHPEGKQLCISGTRIKAAYDGRFYHFARIVDAETGETINEIVSEELEFGSEQGLAYSADGKRLLLVSDMIPTVSVIDPQTGKVLKEEISPSFGVGAINPKGDVSAWIDGGVIRLIRILPTESDKAERLTRSKPSLRFHWQEYRKAVEAGDPTAKKFHEQQAHKFGDEFQKMRIEQSQRLYNTGGNALKAKQYEEGYWKLRQANEYDPTNQNIQKALDNALKIVSEARLTQYQKGEYVPNTKADRLMLLLVADAKKQSLAFVELAKATFTIDPSVLSDDKEALRYKATLHALAVAIDLESKIDEPARAKWRKQAFDWFQAELAHQLSKGVEGKERLKEWLKEERFNSVRMPDLLKKLPEPERTQWQDFWKTIGLVTAN